MLKDLNKKLENMGELLRASISYDFDFEFEPYEFLITKFRKQQWITNNIKKNLYKKLT